MPLFQVGPRPNAVSCLLDPTRLPPGQIHCEPRILVGDRSLRATGNPFVLRDLMDARQQAQTSGIQVDGSIQGSTIAVTAVNFTRRRRVATEVTRPVDRPIRPVAVSRLARLVEPAQDVDQVTLFQTDIEGIAIKLTATRPPGGV